MSDELNDLGTPYNPFTGDDIDDGSQEVEKDTPPVDTPPTDTPPVDNEGSDTPPAESKDDPEGGDGGQGDEPEFNLEFFNKTFETEFADQEAIKGMLSSTSKLKEYEDKLKDLEKLQTDYNQLNEKYETFKKYEDGHSPLDYFSSEEDYKVQQYLKENPDKDYGVTYEAFKSDLSKIDDFDLLVKYEKFNDKTLEGGEAGIREMLADKYGIDAEEINDPSSWTTVLKNKVRRDANLARKDFEEMKDSVTLPDKVDISGQEAERKIALDKQKEDRGKAWGDITDLMIKDMNEVSVYDTPDKDGNTDKLVDFVLDDKMKSDLGEKMKAYLSENALEPTDANVKEAGAVAQRIVVLENLPQIIKSHTAEALKAQEEQFNKDIHNPKKPKIDDKGSGSSANKDAETEAFATKPLYPEVPRKKLF